MTYEVSSDHHSLTFSWSAPFTLNISDMEPDILHYVVYIIRDDGHNETVSTTDTHYELQADPYQCHQYHVEIAAVNVVGEGEKYRSPAINLEGNHYHLFIMFETSVYSIINAFLLAGYAVASMLDTTLSFDGRVILIQITLEVCIFNAYWDWIDGCQNI